MLTILIFLPNMTLVVIGKKDQDGRCEIQGQPLGFRMKVAGVRDHGWVSSFRDQD